MDRARAVAAAQPDTSSSGSCLLMSGAVPAVSSDCIALVASPGSYRTNSYAAAVKALGFTPLIVTSANAAAVPPGTIGIAAELNDPDSIVDAITRAIARATAPGPGVGRVRAAIGIDDATVEVAARVAARFDLPHNPPDAARATRDKALSRICLSQVHGLSIPQFELVDSALKAKDVRPSFAPPWVVKPTTMSASQGVIRVDTLEELPGVIDRVRAIAEKAGHATAPLLIEKFVAGFEIAVEGMLIDGEFVELATFDKPEPLDGPFFEETYYITPGRFEECRGPEIYSAVARACAALGLVTGPVHAELRVDGDDLWILEVAGRTIGGDCAGLFQVATDIAVENLVISTAAGAKPQSNRVEGAAGVLMIPVSGAGILRRVEGISAALDVPGVLDVRIDIREGYELVPWPEGNSYPGFIFATASSPERVYAALKAAHAKLKFVLAPSLPVQVTKKTAPI